MVLLYCQQIYDWHKLFPLWQIMRLIVLLISTSLNLHSPLVTLPAWISLWAIRLLPVEPQNTAICNHAQAESPCTSAMTTSGSDQPLAMSPISRSSSSGYQKAMFIRYWSKATQRLLFMAVGSLTWSGCTCYMSFCMTLPYHKSFWPPTPHALSELFSPFQY